MSVGFWQLVLILAIILVLFGVGKLPRVMGDLGKGIRNFKAGLEGKEGETETPPQIEPTKTDQTKP